MAEDPASAWTRVYCLIPYNPWKRGGAPNPAFSTASDGRILDLKEGKPHAIRQAARGFRAAGEILQLPAGTILAILPGHEASVSNEHRPLARVAHALADADSRYVARVDTLVRTVTIASAALSGDRSLRRQLTSMRVMNPLRVRGATVLVLDDTVTTGRSIEAARTLISEAGAVVAAVALGRTVKYF